MSGILEKVVRIVRIKVLFENASGCGGNGHKSEVFEVIFYVRFGAGIGWRTLVARYIELSVLVCVANW